MNIDGQALLMTMIMNELNKGIEQDKKIKAVADVFEKYGVKRSAVLPMLMELRQAVEENTNEA